MTTRALRVAVLPGDGIGPEVTTEALAVLAAVAEAGGVMKVWNGPQMQELRRKHLANDLRDVPPCRSCTEWSWWKPGPFSSKGNSPQDR